MRFSDVGIITSDWITAIVATWSFVTIYTGAMLVWMWLNGHGIINIDPPPYMGWNLFLSWFAGTQASLVLMSANRQASRDRDTLIAILQLEEKIERIIDKKMMRGT